MKRIWSVLLASMLSLGMFAVGCSEDTGDGGDDECSVNADCPEGQICFDDGGSKSCEVGCAVDGDCGAGESCTGGACISDDPGPGQNPDMGPGQNPDMGPGMNPDMGPGQNPDMNPDMGPDMNFDCTQIPAAANIGAECSMEAQDFCGAGGACVTLSEEVPPSCAGVCVPGVCELVCTGDEQCVPLQDPMTGEPIMLEGVAIGACAVPPVGEQTAFQACGGNAGACDGDSDCLVFEEGQEEGLCFPRCEGQGSMCPTVEGIEGQCVLTTGQGMEPDHCGLICDAGNDGTPEGCPTDLTCTVLGGNNVGLCL